LPIKRGRGVMVFDEGKERKRIFGRAGRDNPLKRLILDKRVQENQGISLENLAGAWIGLARF
jgi:hypothetical protein